MITNRTQNSNTTVALTVAIVGLMDELLAALLDSSHLPHVFGRISSIAQKALPHDAIALTMRLADGRHERVYASSGLPASLPETMAVPKTLLKSADWEHDIFDNLSLLTESNSARFAAMGYASLLRVPVRLDGRLAGALIFLDHTPWPSPKLTFRWLAALPNGWR